MKSLSKKKTNKAEWEKDYYDRFANIENGRRMYYPIRDFIRSLLQKERELIKLQYEKRNKISCSNKKVEKPTL